MNKEKLIYFSALIFCILGGGVLFFIFMKYIFISLLPFLIAWAVAFAVRRPAALLSKKIRIPERVTRVILAILGILLFVAVGCGLVWQTVSMLWRFLSELGDDELDTIIRQLSSVRLGTFGKNLPDGLYGELGEAFKNALNSILTELGGTLTGWIGTVPKILVFAVISLIATVYFALDLERVNSAVEGIMPKRLFRLLVRIKNGFMSVGIKYIRSYTLIMLITFVIMTAGFLILRVRDALLIALIVALLDILPVIGVGTVLVPWSIFSFVTGNTFAGFGLLALLIINEVTRQFAEPRIIGKNLNIHPLVTLLLLYVGYTLLGFVGLILLPLAAVLINVAIPKNDTPKV